MQGDEVTKNTWNKFTPMLAAFFVFSYFMIAIGVVIKDVNAAFTGAGLIIAVPLVIILCVLR
jgi:hypothetical protein